MNLFATTIIDWYKENKRDLPWRDTKDPYKIWISEIILQQTRVVQGYDYYCRFMEHFPDVETLAKASEDEVMKCWQGLGYYSRARNLHAAARILLDDWTHYVDEFIQVVPIEYKKVLQEEQMKKWQQKIAAMQRDY